MSLRIYRAANHRILPLRTHTIAYRSARFLPPLSMSLQISLHTELTIMKLETGAFQVTAKTSVHQGNNMCWARGQQHLTQHTQAQPQRTKLCIKQRQRTRYAFKKRDRIAQCYPTENRPSLEAPVLIYSGPLAPTEEHCGSL